MKNKIFVALVAALVLGGLIYCGVGIYHDRSTAHLISSTI